MSDIEDDNAFNDEEDADLDVNEETEGNHSRRHDKHRHRLEEDDDDEDDVRGGAEDEDEEEEEDPGDARARKRRKRGRFDPGRFLDIIADVDDDEDDDEEDEDLDKDGFLEDAGPETVDLSEMNRRAADHARFDRRQRELNDEDLARIAQDVTLRYKPTAQKYTGDMNEIPQRLLMPSVQDANLWQVRVRPGKERELVFSLMRKAMELELTARPLQILSAFQRDSLPGMIYVEARSAQQVLHAINGLVGVYPSRGVILVPIEEMASLLQIKKKETTITPGSWVRIKRGKYGGDLAQVLDIDGEDIGLKFVPRIDLNPKDEIISADGKKRKKLLTGASVGPRPPQRLFNYEDVVKAHGRRAVAKRNQVYVFGNETFKDGYIEKDFKLSALLLENVNPTLDEIMKFTRQEDGVENESNVDLSVIAEAAKKEAITVLQPGDYVEVFEGEQTGVQGVVESIANDVVTIRAQGGDLDGQKVDVPARSLRKRFKAGDHVKVMSGHNRDETGLVVAVAENIVTFLSDMSMQEVSVFSKDLREAAEVGSSTNIIGNYELHDMVQIDTQTVGVIFKTERDSFRVLDQNNHVRVVLPHQITMRRESERSIATDAEGHALRIRDNVKEVEGEGRKGQVLHIYQSFFAFLFNRDLTENGGVFVARARALVSVAPKGNVQKPGAIDTTKMNPSVNGGAGGGMVGSQMFRGPRDRLIGVSISVTKGPYKAHIGTVKDVNGNLARVELQSGNRLIMIDKSKLMRRNPDGTLEMLEGRRPMAPPNGFGQHNFASSPFQGMQNPYNSGTSGKTPHWGGGRTPMPSSGDSRTPAWNASRTPNPYAGGKTPAWNANAQTPAWNSNSRTPNPYAEGSRTPAWNATSSSRDQSSMGRTPSHQAQTSAWGGNQTPRWGGGDHNDTWDSAVDSAQTPAASAPTPGAWPNDNMGWPANRTSSAYPSAPTPAASAPTPAAAPTPGPTYDEIDPDRNHWLLYDQFQTKKGIIATIASVDFSDRLENGKYDGEKVVIDSMQDIGKIRGSFAYVHLPSKKIHLNVEIKYLQQVFPQHAGDRVIVIKDAPGSAFDAGTVCMIARPPENGMVEVVSEFGSVTIGVEYLTLYQG